MKAKFLSSFIFMMITICSCQVVKPYQRVYLNDHDMKPGERGSAKHERNALTYREGASGGGNGKATGGCGCN